MLGVFVHLEDPFATKFELFWLMSWDVASIYPHHFTSSKCNLFCEVHQSLPPAAKHPHNMLMPPPCFTVGMVFFRLQATPFLLQTNRWSFLPNSSIFVSSDQRTFLRRYDLCPHVQLQTVVCLFYGGFGAVASSLLISLSGYVDIGLVFTVDIDTFVPVSTSIFTGSFAVVLWLLCTFSTKVRSFLGDRTRLLPERYSGCVVPWCFYLRTIDCTDECAFGNCSQGWTRLVEVCNFFSGHAIYYTVLWLSLVCFAPYGALWTVALDEVLSEGISSGRKCSHFLLSSSGADWTRWLRGSGDRSQLIRDQRGIGGGSTAGADQEVPEFPT